MDHFKEDLASKDEFKGIADGALQAPPDTLVNKIYTVIRELMKSHSRRPNQLKYTWSINLYNKPCMNYTFFSNTGVRNAHLNCAVFQ